MYYLSGKCFIVIFFSELSVCVVGFYGLRGLHRRNGFYTVQAVCAIALHLPYT